MASGKAFIAVGKLDDLIHDPQLRRQFHEHPDATLRNAGGDPDDVPRHVWQALTDMSLTELGAIATLGIALRDDGLLDGSLPWRHGV